MNKFDVVILTDARYTENSDTDIYIQNVNLEDNLVKQSLEKIGLNVTRKSWDDVHFNWSSTSYVLFRSTWDYFDRFEEFSNWLTTTSKQTKLLNSEFLIHWNIDKHYLLDLQKKGVHICETYFVEQGDTRSLGEIVTTLNYSNFVIKPCVSGGARETYKISIEQVSHYEKRFANLISNEAMMIQPFQKNIVDKGEISLMVMNGKFTHAILKIAKPGDFRVQDDFGGSVHDYKPTKEEIEFAENTVKSCPELPIYARVDVFLDNQNKLALAELELIEPELWFRHCSNSADELAKGIKYRMQQNEKVF